MPCGHEGFSFYAVWAACAAGGRWGPVRGCRPSEAPSALPPDDPAGLVICLHSHGLAHKGLPYSIILEGCAASASGASSLRSAISLRAAQCHCAPSH